MSGYVLDKDAAEYHLFCGCHGRGKEYFITEIKNDKSMLQLLPLQKDDRALPCYEYAKKLFSLVFERSR